MRLVLTRYSQCLPASTTSVTTTKSTTTTTSTSATATAAPTGFVKVSGQKFTLNGATYTVVGCTSLFL
jgi:mannan endo-1,4-beta-mannosidase